MSDRYSLIDRQGDTLGNLDDNRSSEDFAGSSRREDEGGRSDVYNTASDTAAIGRTECGSVGGVGEHGESRSYGNTSDRSEDTSGNDTSRDTFGVDSSKPPSYYTRETKSGSKSKADEYESAFPSNSERMGDQHAPETRMGISHVTEPYLGSTDHGSGTTGGPGHGNKTAADPDVDTSTVRLDSAQKTEPYLGGTEYGSGTTAGPGAGNKTAGPASKDSTVGKLMEKAGEVFKKDNLAEKGHEKREAAGYGRE